MVRCLPREASVRFVFGTWKLAIGGKGTSSINSRKNDTEVFQGSQALVFSPDNKTLIHGDRNGKLQLWDITTENQLITLNGHTAQVETLYFSPDGNTLISAAQDGTILLWDWDEILKGSSTMDE